MISTRFKQGFLFAALLICRYSFTAGCSALVGGAMALRMVHAQGIEERLSDRERILADAYKIQSLEYKISQLQGSTDTLTREINLQENEISKMEGIGVGLGVILAILQILQAYMSKNLRP